MKKLKIKKFSALVLLLIIIASCGLVVENDISKENVILLSPGDTTDFSEVNFVWEEIDDALFYRIQIASPSFQNLGQILVDTNLTITNFQFELVPGNYEWRVRGENEGYETPYAARPLVVGVDKDLTDQDVILVSPVNKTRINDTTGIEFEWEKLQAASAYRVQVYSEVGGATETIHDKETPDNSISLDFPSRNNTYRWKVKALNDISSTKFSLEWTFEIDTTGLNNLVFKE